MWENNVLRVLYVHRIVDLSFITKIWLDGRGRAVGKILPWSRFGAVITLCRVLTLYC